ncbi:MAG: flagellar basal body rod protein FlgB [Desulfobacterales bacterium]|jgi:flagellar basal-body rod protein FlgB|nr:flagellar basal body rod protein FlgB [Desulfobacterales bacterium]
MANSLVTDNTINFLGKALSAGTKRHGLISANVANIDTIGYKAKDIDFKKMLTEVLEGETPGVLEQTQPRHFPRGTPLTLSGEGEVITTGETVDIDQEMTRLAENNINYRTNLEMLLRKMNLMRTAVTEGGR